MPRLPALTVADCVSLSRLALAGAFVVARGASARLALIAASGATDYLDGWLARRRGSSRFGAVLDPATDRAFVLVVVATLLFEGTMTIAQVLILMARDIVTTAGVIVVRVVSRLRTLPIEARRSGKVVTALQFVVLIGVVADARTLPWLLGLTAIAAGISIVDYSAAAWRARAAVLTVAVLAGLPTMLGAQRMPGVPESDGPSRVRFEARADAFVGRSDALHGGVGVAADLGTYFRLAGIVGAGVASAGGESSASGRAEVVGRFLLDPYRQARWGLYGGAGVIARHDGGAGTRGYLTLILGAELPGQARTVTAVEVGLGSGARLGVAIRQGRQSRR